MSSRYTGHKTLAAVLSLMTPGSLLLAALNFADDETPSGVRNGVNRVFTLQHAPNPPASLQLFLNGMALRRSPQGDYTLSGNTITLAKVLAPEPDDGHSPFLAWYRY